MQQSVILVRCKIAFDTGIIKILGAKVMHRNEENMKKQMKILCACFLSVVLSITTIGCEQKNSADKSSKTDNINTQTKDTDISADISLWTFPLGTWADKATVSKVIKKFNEKYPNINVEFKALDYDTGDAVIEKAIKQKQAPDIVLEGPERLVSNWGDNGYLINLNDMWTDDVVSDVVKNNTSVLAACIGSDGNYYEYPLCMNTHCMAVNKELFEKSGAMKYIDQKKRTWTTEGFQKALKALKAYGVKKTGVVYCGGQGGDQGTRALAMNLYSAKFTNGTYTQWTMDSSAGIRGIQQLVDWVNAGLLSYDPNIVAADELGMFASKKVAMTFCWNASNRVNYASEIDFTPYAVAFPSDDGVPELAGGLPGFCVFNNEDENRQKAAKIFISYLCNDSEQGAESIRMSGFFPVKASSGDVYKGTDNEKVMQEFSSMMKYLGDYYNVAPGWAEQRTAWWMMLQKVFAGKNVSQEVKAYTKTCNKATDKALKE